MRKIMTGQKQTFAKRIIRLVDGKIEKDDNEEEFTPLPLPAITTGPSKPLLKKSSPKSDYVETHD